MRVPIRQLRFAAALLFHCTTAALAHDLPADITAHVLLKPEGERLQALIRMPLTAIRDIDFPQDERGYLDIEKLAPLLTDAATVWVGNVMEIREGDRRLPPPRVAATQISSPSDRSFATFDEALRHVTGPKPANRENLVWDQVLFDILLEYPIHSDGSRFSIRPGLEGLAGRVVTVLRFLAPGKAVRAYEFRGDPGLVPLDPRWHQAALRFVELGFLHILDGTDHLLFLLCLVIPLRSLRPLVLVVTAFTVAHSLALLAAAWGFTPDALWFPPLVETFIAMSIVYMALENIAGGSTVRRRWIAAFGFGLIHGFGFSFVLGETMQFAGSHLLTSLLAFNLGVELGQLLVLAVLIPMLTLLFRFVVAERMGTILVSALVAHTGWHWMVDRWERFRQFPMTWSAPGAAALAAAMWWMMWGLILAALAWAAQRVVRQRGWRSVRPES